MEDEKLERDAAKILFSTPTKPEEPVAAATPKGPEIEFVCPFCNETYQVSVDLAGKKINCRNCREPCRVDSIKSTSEPRSVPMLWLGLGVVIGILATVLVVVALKLARIL